MKLILAAWMFQAQSVVFENDYVRVTENAVPCASATAPGCGDRVIVALSELTLRVRGSARSMSRGDIEVFMPDESYASPTGGRFYEVAFKPDHPPVLTPDEMIPPAKNAMLYDGPRFFAFEERLEVGDTRPRHSHSQRVVIQLNRTVLQQWPDGRPEVIRDILPEQPKFNEPVIHVVKNVGELPLRGIVIELKVEDRG